MDEVICTRCNDAGWYVQFHEDLYAHENPDHEGLSWLYHTCSCEIGRKREEEYKLLKGLDIHFRL